MGRTAAPNSIPYHIPYHESLRSSQLSSSYKPCKGSATVISYTDCATLVRHKMRAMCSARPYVITVVHTELHTRILRTVTRPSSVCQWLSSTQQLAPAVVCDTVCDTSICTMQGVLAKPSDPRSQAALHTEPLAPQAGAQQMSQPTHYKTPGILTTGIAALHHGIICTVLEPVPSVWGL